MVAARAPLWLLFAGHFLQIHWSRSNPERSEWFLEFLKTPSWEGCNLLTRQNCHSTRVWQGWKMEDQLFVNPKLYGFSVLLIACDEMLSDEFDGTYQGGKIHSWVGHPLGTHMPMFGDAALSFDSEEAAKAFGEKHGWDYVVKKRHTPLLKVKSYADNFKWKGPPKADE